MRFRKLRCLPTIAFAVCTSLVVAQERLQRADSPTGEQELAVATFGSGCFWCTEAVFEQLNGVESAVSGYAGGRTENPTYKTVSKGRTGHAEVVQVTYNPEVITYEKLLEVFWKSHDPTTLNRQGNDVGTQYRSIILYHDEAQKESAEKYKDLLNKSGAFPRPIVTQIVPFTTWYVAEDYHQDYFRKNPYQAYCNAVIAPKVAKIRQVFSEEIKAP